MYSRSMRATATCQSFLRSPVGSYLRGRSWLVACPYANLCATVLAGRPDEQDLRELTSAYAVPEARVSPHAVLFDGSLMTTVDDAALGMLLAYFVEHQGRLTRFITRLAVVYGTGVAGAVVAGAPKMLSLSCPVQSFSDTGAALDWLGFDEAALRHELAALSQSLADDATLARLRALLTERPGATLSTVARLLGTSGRSLQRRLKERGTSFQSEVTQARLARALPRLAACDGALTAIALDIGFESLQSFSDWFRQQTGESPLSWRRRHQVERQ